MPLFCWHPVQLCRRFCYTTNFLRSLVRIKNPIKKSFKKILNRKCAKSVMVWLVVSPPRGRLKRIWTAFRRGSNMVGSTWEYIINVSRFKPALGLNQLLAVQRRCSNSLNLALGFVLSMTPVWRLYSGEELPPWWGVILLIWE